MNFSPLFITSVISIDPKWLWYLNLPWEGLQSYMTKNTWFYLKKMEVIFKTRKYDHLEKNFFYHVTLSELNNSCFKYFFVSKKNERAI